MLYMIAQWLDAIRATGKEDCKKKKKSLLDAVLR